MYGTVFKVQTHQSHPRADYGRGSRRNRGKPNTHARIKFHAGKKM